MHNRILITLIFVYSMLPIGTFADSIAVWSESDNGNGNIQLLAARKDQSGITSIKVITERGANITPSIFIHDGQTWITWVNRFSPDRYSLNYAVLDSRSLNILEKGIIRTIDPFIYSPAIAVSPQGHSWVAWSGTNSGDEEIKVSKYENGMWSIESNITHNNVPDFQPSLSINDNKVMLGWRRLNDSKEISMSLQLSFPSTAERVKESVNDGSNTVSGPFDPKIRKLNGYSRQAETLFHQRDGFLMGITAEIAQ
jgi:hypothetical protein